MAKEKKEKRDGSWLDPFLVLRNRVLAGFFVALPIIVTFIIIRWLYDFIAKDIILATAGWIQHFWGDAIDSTNLPPLVVNYLAPVLAIVVILSTLFMLGMFFQSRTHRLIDWILKKVPLIGMIYSSVSNAIESFRKTKTESGKFQRVVLIKFPHPGIKAPAFVTSSSVDKATGRNILCVYVPTTPLPTSGYMLMVPEEEVTDITWDLPETLQAIVSGGITVPREVEYFGERVIVDISKSSGKDSKSSDNNEKKIEAEHSDEQKS